MDSNFGFMFYVVPIIVIIIFCLVGGIIIFAIIKGITQWNKNNNSPVLTVNATVVAKRMDVSHSGGSTVGNDSMHSSSTWYYATFQVDSGDRIELLVPNQEYGMLVEGDIGNLTFQGTRYKSFVREAIPK